MKIVLLIYASVIIVSFITGIFVTIYNNKHKQNNTSNTKPPKKDISKTLINEPPLIEPDIDDNKTYYDLPVIVSIIDDNPKEVKE